MQIAVRIEGDALEKLMRRLRNVDAGVRKKILRPAVMAAGNAVRDRARALAPISNPTNDPELVPGLLKKSQTTKVKMYRGMIFVAIVGAATLTQTNRRARTRETSAFGKRAAKLAAKLGSAKAAKQAPSNYSHLAGPGRKQKYLTQAASDLGGSVRSVLEDRIEKGIEEVWG